MTTRTDDPNHKRLRRFCKDCNKMFEPTGKFQRLCLKCVIKRRKKSAKLKNRWIQPEYKRYCKICGRMTTNNNYKCKYCGFEV